MVEHGLNLPDDFDSEAWARANQPSWQDCETCPYYRLLERDGRSAEVCTAGDLELVPEERGCEL